MGKVNSITKLEIAIFVFLTMMISGASSIASNDFIRIIVVGLLALYSFINHKNLYNNILFYLLSGWILINLISSLYFGKNIDFFPFIGKIVLIYLAYLCLSCCKDNFWDKFLQYFISYPCSFPVCLIALLLYSVLLPLIFFIRRSLRNTISMLSFLHIWVMETSGIVVLCGNRVHMR